MIAEGPSAKRPPHIALELSVPFVSSRSLKLTVLGLAVAAASVIAGCDRQSAQDKQPAEAASPAAAAGDVALKGTLDRSHKGSQMPDFTFADPTGKSLRLQTLKGKPLLVNLWATWCAPCVLEMPMLDKLAAQGKVKVLTVSQDMGQPDKVAEFFKTRGFKALEPWLDPESELSFHYNTGTLPTTVLYDSQGREVWRFVGGHDWGNAETAKMLAEAK
jgi:thiol-disulfide isomerase/thioredoxin